MKPHVLTGALVLAAALTLAACGNGTGRPAWCAAPVTAQVGFSGAPAQTIRVSGQQAQRLAQDIMGAATAGELAGGGYLSEVLSVPGGYPAGLRHYAAQFNSSRNDTVMLMGFSAAWSAEYQAHCQ